MKRQHSGLQNWFKVFSLFVPLSNVITVCMPREVVTGGWAEREEL
jgi:hypothetical protein